MESDWQEVARSAIPPPNSRAASTPVTCCAFDNSQELLWTGTEYGRIASFYGPELQRYTSYKGSAQHEGATKQILVCDKGVLSVGTRSLHLAEKRGRPTWHLTNRDFHDLRCACFTSKTATELILAGCQPLLFVVDVEKGEIVQSKPAAENYTMMRRGGQYICAATATGSVQLIEPKTLEVLKTWKAHMGWISDMDANSNFLVTCGYSPRQHFGNMPDPLAKVFDLKTLMPLPPVQFHAGASFVRMHPRMLTTSIIASQNGQIQVVDIMDSTMVNVRQVNIVETFLTSLDVAPSGEALALTDSVGFIHLWGSPGRMHYIDYSTPTDFGDDIPEPKVSVDWNGNVSLNSIGMPYYRETLLSSWPSHLVFSVGAPPPRIDPAVIASLSRHPEASGAYAPNPRKARRNQVQQENRFADTIRGTSLEGPKFLSEQARDGDEEQFRRLSEAFGALSSSNALQTRVPKLYQNVEIQYSKFGVDDFDFGYYNNTRFSGLETHIANSYANSLLQLLRFTPWIRNVALLHTAGDCLFEDCLLCELGFLIDMLEKANGLNCQATNFLKAFGNLSHAASLGLHEEGAIVRPLGLMIQATNRFLLEKIAADYRKTSAQPHMDKVLITAAMNSIRCGNCMNETKRHGGTCVHELVYPVRPGRTQARPTFSQTLKASVERQDQTRGWCDRCKRYQQLNARKTIQSTPPVLTINTAIHSVDAKQVWAKPGWLPAEIGIIVESGQFFCYEGQDLKLHVQRGAFQITIYELVGLVAEISSGEAQMSHLVSLINVTPSLRQKQDERQWHIFNDFSVHGVSEEEALKFDPSWKLPSILTFQVKSARHAIDDTWKQKLSVDLLYSNSLFAGDPVDAADGQSRFCALDPRREHPRPGTVVGIDAEFVMMQQEELEIKVDGSRALIRPPRLALGRISVLRGGTLISNGKVLEETTLHCVPFIDDYIQVTELIVDHLTEYSGIHPGDLDPKLSRYRTSGQLISLKLAYKKIWLLLNMGCIFVGHGLAKDFRTINIQIPKEQVIDTVSLFYDKARARKLSLRFLSWYLLGEFIQQEATPGDGNDLEDLQAAALGHDSIIDAKMALRLWDKWRELESRGLTDRTIEEIYRKGRELNFKPPGASISSSSVGLSGMGLSGMGLSGVSLSGVGLSSGDMPSSAAMGITSTPGTPAARQAGYVGLRSGLQMTREIE